MPALPQFRNDDVSFDTEMQYFTQFCEIFHKHGFTQVHAITLHGLCNYKNKYHGEWCVYKDYPTLSILDNKTIRQLSQGYNIIDNKELIEYLRNSKDEIALHGLYHEDYSKMTEQEQLETMQAGLAELKAIFPEKAIRFFVPPFNKYNENTIKVANALHLRVLRDEGIHLEDRLNNLVFEPGIWYRYHHHRFYPSTTFDGILGLSLENLDHALAKGKANSKNKQAPLPMPSFDYEGNTAILEELIKKYDAQSWYLLTAQNRLARKELIALMGFIYSHFEHDCQIFEVGCGAGNNLVWLEQHGYSNLGGSDLDPKALAVAKGMAESLNSKWHLVEDDLLKLEHLPEQLDLILAMNCTYLLDNFDLNKFFNKCSQHLTKNGCLALDIVDQHFNGNASSNIHSSQWLLPKEEQTRASEYKKRYALDEVKQIAEQNNLEVLALFPDFQLIPRIVYILAKKGNNIQARRALPILEMPEALVEPTIKAIFLSGLFDYEWYRKQYVKGLETMDPLQHYVRFGATRGYFPNANFDSAKYRAKYMDLLDPTNPLLHSIHNRYSDYK